MTFHETGMPVQELVETIKSSIDVAGLSATNPDRDLRIAQVDLVLQVISAEKVGGGIDLRVPVIGMKLRLGTSISRRRTHTVTMELEPRAGQRHEVRGYSPQETIVDAIETIREVIAAAADGPDPLVLKSSVVELAFAVTEQGTLTLVLDGTVDDETVQTLRLVIINAT
jgi:hypothetical protein